MTQPRWRVEERNPPSPGQLAADVRAGLTQRPVTIPPKWFYDEKGSELFDAITQLPEYYPTRTEQAILEATLNGRPLIETFVQPGGMEPDAENLHNLPGGRGYYVLQIAANRHKPGYVDRMVHNKPVPMMHGKPVNPGFVFTRHVRKIEWDRRRKLIVGIDNGYTAAAVLVQRTELGQLRTLGDYPQLLLRAFNRLSMQIDTLPVANVLIGDSALAAAP